ncbi:hypothetical protein [Streptomyces sp. CNQ085]|uniref:hypothetical protein n=1 Tax=Streptomyces sp. CNQ085 TaxID=2886944 RepID=UPI001F50AB22|nr:hypothetical protein [Streptomyces sp. CNQ085]MCI0386179.1 hypothetical protein [Streptomyces sp. CNQ085]
MSPDPEAETVVLGDLDGLADALAALVGGAVTIEDTRSQVLAHSSTWGEVDELRMRTVLGKRVPEWRVAAMREDGFFRMLWGSGDVIHRPAGGENPERLVAAVRAGGEVLGSIWVAAEGRPLAPGAADTLRAAARAAARHLVSHRTRGGRDRHVEDAARALLAGRGPAASGPSPSGGERKPPALCRRAREPPCTRRKTARPHGLRRGIP